MIFIREWLEVCQHSSKLLKTYSGPLIKLRIVTVVLIGVPNSGRRFVCNSWNFGHSRLYKERIHETISQRIQRQFCYFHEVGYIQIALSPLVKLVEALVETLNLIPVD